MNQEIEFNSNNLLILGEKYNYRKANLFNENKPVNNQTVSTEKKLSENKPKTIESEVITNAKKFLKSEVNSTLILNLTKINNLTFDLLNNSARDIYYEVYSRNITINNTSDIQNLKHDLRVLNFDLINITNYFQSNKPLSLIFNINFKNNNKSILTSNKNNYNTSITCSKTSNLKDKLKVKENKVKKLGLSKNKTNLENKIKDFISSKILNRTLNISHYHNITEKQITEIVIDFNSNVNKIYLKNRTTKNYQRNKTGKITPLNNHSNNVNNNNNYTLSENNSNLFKNFNNSNNTSFNNQLNSSYIIHSNIDSISEKIALIFKRVLIDILSNPSNYIKDNNIEKDFYKIKHQIKDSFKESLDNNNSISKLKKIIKNKIGNNKTINKPSIVKIKPTSNSTSVINRINFIQVNLNKTSETKKNITEVYTRNNTNREILNLIKQKINEHASNRAFENKIEFLFKNSSSKRVEIYRYNNKHNEKKPNFENRSLNKKITNTSKTHILEIKKHNDKNVTVEYPIKNKTISKDKFNLRKLPIKNETVKIQEKFESSNNSIKEIQKKIVSHLPNIKMMIKDKKILNKINNLVNTNNFTSTLNKTSNIVNNNYSKNNQNLNVSKIYMNLIQNYNVNKIDNTSENKINIKDPKFILNITKFKSNIDIDFDMNRKKNILEYLKKENNVKIKFEINKKIEMLNKASKNKTKSNEKNMFKSNKSISKDDKKRINLNNKTKNEYSKKYDLEIEDGSMMADLLEEYKIKFRKNIK